MPVFSIDTIYGTQIFPFSLLLLLHYLWYTDLPILTAIIATLGTDFSISIPFYSCDRVPYFKDTSAMILFMPLCV